MRRHTGNSLVSSSLARLTHLHRVQSGLLCDLEMALSASVVKVFVIGKGFFTSHILLADVKDAGDFVAAIQRKFALSDIDALHLELRVVSTEPDRDNATALFDASAFEIKNSATLPKPGAWVVGKIVALQSAAGAAASVNGAAYALAGSGAGAGSVADAFKRLPDGHMPQLFHAILNSAVIGIYDGKTPVSTAVFFSSTRALTAHHDARPEVGAVLSGSSSPADGPTSVRKWKFKVVASSPRDDLVVLEIVSGPTPNHFLPITGNPSIGSLRDTKLWLATFGISVAKMAAESPLDIHLGSDRLRVEVRAYGGRHLVYHASTGRGDSGGALISKSGQLVGLHLGGWNDASPPPSPPSAAATSAAAAPSGGARGGRAARGAGGDAAARRKNRERALAMGLAELGTASRKSIVKLAQQLTAGGYAIYLGNPIVAALCSAPSEAAEGVGGGGSDRRSRGGGSGSYGALVGKKRRAPGGSGGGVSGGSSAVKRR